MNKTLLLIMCDFLLLNLLALTHWEKAVPSQQIEAPPSKAQLTPSSAPATKNQDMVDVMKLSLEDERKQREQLAQQLQSARSTLQSREQNVAQLENERTKLSTTLNSTQQKAAELAQQVEQSAHDAAISRERLAQMQSELQQRQAEAERQKQQLASLSQQQQEAQQRIESLNVSVKVAEQEKALLRDTNESLKTQVVAERQERLKVQETTTQLAHGVGQIAEQSTQLTKEIRDNRPINANTLFSDFLANRVDTDFIARHGSLFGTVNREKQTRTVLFSDGKQTYALLHVDDTPFAIRDLGPDWEYVSAQFSKGGYLGTASVIDFLRVDPRIVVLPVTKEQAAALGTKVYELAGDPFKFPEVVLISSGGAGYGEVAFHLDPTEPRYVKVDNHLFKRLFGDFSPSRGDLVLSKTGELLGIMANSDYCVILNDFASIKSIHTGDAVKDQHTGDMFAQLDAWLKHLPLKLQ